MKKIFHFIGLALRFVLWTYVYCLIVNAILIYFWNFNIFSKSGWQLISTYWNNGGIIRTWQDYLLIFILIAYIPMWLLGWKKIKKLNILHILAAPFAAYHQRKLEKYEEETSHIRIKNMGTETIKIEDEIERRAKPTVKVATDEGVNKIRAEVAQKINSVKNEQN